MVFILFACVTDASFAQRGSEMSSHETYFNLIEQFNPNERSDTNSVAIVLRHPSQAFRLLRTDNRFAMWSQWLTDAFEDRRPMYLVVRRVDSVIDNIRLTSLHRIDSLQLTNDNQQLKVGMLPSPSFYHVSVNHPSYKEIRATLQDALENMRQIYIVFGDVPLEIVDARVPDQAWAQP